MVKRHAKVGQQAVDALHAVVAHEILQKRKIAVYKCKPRVIYAVLPGVHILVEAVEVSLGSKPLHYGTAVPAATECNVDIRAIRLDVKSLHALIEQSRNMINICRHKGELLLLMPKRQRLHAAQLCASVCAII